MRPMFPAALGFAFLAVPFPAAAQDADMLLPEDRGASSLAEISDTLADPGRQQELALMARAMSEVLLDLPIAPLTEALAEIAGEEAPVMDGGTTLRSIAPEASRVPEEIEEHLPRAMNAMSTLAGAMEVMVPELRAMARRFEDALPGSR